MQLRELLHDFAEVDFDATVNGLVLDSRALSAGQAFIALPGAHHHGLHYAEQVTAQGASAIIYDPKGAVAVPQGDYPLVAVEQLDAKLGAIAARYYGQPAEHLQVIGITGTNGKTSCSQFLGQLLEQCGIIGTLGWGQWGELVLTGYTTPDALSTQTMLAEFVRRHCQYVSMEVSSHGLAEGRVNALRFKGAILTNISRDHLDFHGSMEAYIETKLSLFAKADTEFVVLNLDDAQCERFMQVVPHGVAQWGYSTKDFSKAGIHNVQAQNIRPLVDGLSFDLYYLEQKCAVKVPFYGAFNVENLLAVATVLLALGFKLEHIAEKLMQLSPVNGRMQRFGSEQTPLIFVDYAHTPDALEKVLQSAREHCQQNLWVVFGCGGDRDTGKRAQMGRIAEQYADHVVVTNDNPRSEEPQSIIAEILSACQQQEKIKVMPDRAAAIEFALAQLSTKDCVVIAGKGHEDYQEIGSQKIPFSDADVVRQWLIHGVLN